MNNRKLHLWIGLLTSVLVLVESVTGLLLAEPQLMGVTRPSVEQRMQFDRTRPDQVSQGNAASGEDDRSQKTVNNSQVNSVDTAAPSDVNQVPNFRGGENFRGGRNQQSGLMGFVRNLHAGRVGNTNVKILLDITAVGLIVLTVTGIVLSVRILRAQSKRSAQTPA